jgi:hypothetical protein
MASCASYERTVSRHTEAALCRRVRSQHSSHAWPYQRFELGFPTVADEDIMEYAEEPARPTNTVYGFVPVAAVLLVITKHGGPDKEARALVDKVSTASHPCDVIE